MGGRQATGRMRRALIAIGILAFAAVSCAAIQGTSESPTLTPTPGTLTETPPRTWTPTPSSTPTATTSPTATATATPLAQVEISSEASETSFVVPLTMQRLNSFDALAHFELEEPSAGYLIYRPDVEPMEGWWVIRLDPSQSKHSIPIVGLTPGTRYVAQVGIGSDLTDLRAPQLFEADWGPLRFDAPKTGMPSLRVGVVGDSGFGDERTRDLVDLMNGYDLDFVLHTGDLAYRPFEEASPEESYAKKYFEVLSPLLLNAPIYPVMGNHDHDPAVRSEGVPFFVRAFPSLSDVSVPENAIGTWYAFGRSGVQFLMLDSQAFHGTGGKAEQTQWLAERLADPNYRFSLPVFHTPPYTSGRHRNDGQELRLRWTPLFEDASVPLVLSGHDHNYERIVLDGVTYVVSGGGSAVLYGETGRVEGSQDFHRRTHFVLLEIGELRIELTAIDLSGNVIDQTTIVVP